MTLPHEETGLSRQLQLDRFLRREGATVLGVDVFADLAQLESTRWERMAGALDAPKTALRVRKHTPGGIQVRMLSGIASAPVIHGGRVIGRVFEDDGAVHCVLGDVRPATTTAPREEQAAEVFRIIQEALGEAGMDFRDTARTWFYLDHILDWYTEFNQVRTSFFRRHGVVRTPASTGIGTANLAGSAVVAKVLAVRPKNGTVTVRQIGSPQQCEAVEYGSAFSRAMEIADAASRVLYVSGTASIEPGGRTVHIGNVAMQIETTMEVVGALLERAGMGFSDATRAIAYFRRAEDIPAWDEFCRVHSLTRLPVIIAECDICRDDLLFEIELDAARPVKR
ncbi:MAG TPA: RidA family protein [Chthoniobacteraceae bacterium]|nr:RidA family protein [Chthoniobacteraceae bacterium]